ncbi:hypothetical protein [Streptomyces morookaense]|uniref:hypothetical protein n=1 Tax=Streptomyces morookaense TaxID=1970 RepID=UPI003F4CD0D9
MAEIAARPVARERHVQELVERHMETFLRVRFLAGEYSTGPRHGGASTRSVSMRTARP